MKHLVLVGGGPAHLHVLRSFASEALASARVTLVCASAHVICEGLLPAVVAGRIDAEQAAIPLVPLASAAHAAWVQAGVVALDAGSRHIRLTNGEPMGFDALSISIGDAIDREAISGARERALFTRPREPFVALWPQVTELAATRALSLVVIGGGADAFELAMAAQQRLGVHARVTLVSGGEPLLVDRLPVLRDRALRALKHSGVTLIEDACREITATHVVLHGGARLACDAPLIATAHVLPAWLRDSGMALGDDGRVALRASGQSLSHREVFLAGDAAIGDAQAGERLTLNLRRFVAGGALEPHRAITSAWQALRCGDGSAIAGWHDWAVQGAWVRRLIDRRCGAFMARYRGD